MITLSFYKPDDYEDLVSYNLDAKQSKFTTLPKRSLEIINENNYNLNFSVSILSSEKAIGYFVLDFGKDKFDMTENENSVLLRSLSINPNNQGKGVGKAAMEQLQDFIKANFPNCDEIVLAVNSENKTAYKLYLKTGFLDDGKVRIIKNGSQNLLSKKIQ